MGPSVGEPARPQQSARSGLSPNPAMPVIIGHRWIATASSLKRCDPQMTVTYSNVTPLKEQAFASYKYKRAPRHRLKLSLLMGEGTVQIIGRFQGKYGRIDIVEKKADGTSC